MMKYKSILIAAIVSFTIGGLSGGWLVGKWAAVQEADRLQVAMEIASQERMAALASLKTYYENKPPIEVIKTEVEYVIKKIPYPVGCDVTPGERRMLDYSRTGMRVSTSGSDGRPGGTGAVEASERLPRSVEVRAHADAGVNYQQCLAVAKAVHQYLESRATPL